MRLKEFRRGMVFRLDGELWQIQKMDLNTPGNKGSLFQVEMKNIVKGNTLRKRMMPNDVLEDVYLETKEMEFLYQEGDGYVFMDTETYDQITLGKDTVGNASDYMKHNERIKVQFFDQEPVLLELPTAVVLEVVHTEPAARGDTVSNVTKPAETETGFIAKVPPHINQGDKIKIDTRSGDFLGREK
jgi:elongation factor P